MTEKKAFDCPKCGVQSWLDPATLDVTHDEPKCRAWLEMEAAKPVTALEQLAKVLPFQPREAVPPAVVDFHCPECGQPARMHPRAEPIAVQHSEPVCKAWEKIVGKKDDVERYLIKAGQHIHVPADRYLENSAGQGVANAGAQTNDADHK